jgi:hypothetical protein
MAKSDEAKAREQRLAAKLRENLKRRKGQSRARSGTGATPSTPADSSKGKNGEEA